MQLKINASYKTATGFIIPRSHFKTEAKGVKFAVFEIIKGGGISYTKSHTTLSTSEVKKILGLTKSERIEIK